MRLTGLIAVVGLMVSGITAGAETNVRRKGEWKEATVCVWEIVELADPFEVREVVGTVTNQGGGQWPDTAAVVIELVREKKKSVRYIARAEIPSGKFKIKNVQEGEYCFRVSARPTGWTCVEGRIVISRRAPKNSRIDLVVPLGM